MPQYLTPGVYIEEIPAVVPIQGVSTSTAAFIGVVGAVTMPPDPLATPSGIAAVAADAAAQAVQRAAQRLDAVAQASSAATDHATNMAGEAADAKADDATKAVATATARTAADAFAVAIAAAGELVTATQHAIDTVRTAELAAAGARPPETYPTDVSPAAQHAAQAAATAAKSLTDAQPGADPPTTTALDKMKTASAGVAATDHDLASTAAAAAALNGRLVRAGSEPEFVTGWHGFVEKFGDVQDANRILAHAVRGFFLNGGTRCWVVPLAVEDVPDIAVPAAAPFVETALGALSGGEVEGVSLVAVPGGGADVRNKVLAHCEAPDRQDRFAVLDGPSTRPDTPSKYLDGTHTSLYGAQYVPWLDVDGGAPVPPSGHVAGVMARVDDERGVYKAPANEVVRGVRGLRDPVDKQTQAVLNPGGINVIRTFEGTPKVWGARTLSDEQPDYVSVRRTLIYLKQSIQLGTQWVVFEPNGPDLWAKIRRNVTAFLTTSWSDGLLFGDTPAQAFYVACDARTNPEQLRDAGRVTTEIGVAIVRPAEFVVFRIGQSMGATP